jgi:hypothetical protein
VCRCGECLRSGPARPDRRCGTETQEWMGPESRPRTSTPTYPRPTQPHADARWRHPVGVSVRFFVVYFLTLKRVKISESTDMLREVAPVLRRTNNMSRIEPA